MTSLLVNIASKPWFTWAIGGIVISGVGFFGYEYYTCAQKMETWKPAKVSVCLVEKTVVVWWDTVKTIMSTLGDQLWDLVSPAYYSVRDWFKNLGEKIKLWFQGVGHSIREFFVGIGLAIKNWFVQLGRDIKGWFVQAGRDIKDWFLGIGDAIGNWFKDLFTGVFNKIKQAVVNAFKSVKDKLNPVNWF